MHNLMSIVPKVLGRAFVRLGEVNAREGKFSVLSSRKS
jgi:hypothetical protein